MRRHLTGLTVAAGLTLTLAACGSGGSADTTTPASGTAGEASSGGLTPVTVQVMPIVDTAAFHLGLQQGIFEEHGFDVELGSTAQGGAVTIPGVVSGDYDFGFSNSPALVTGISNGLDLVVIGNASASNGEADADTAGVLVAPDSGIESMADLAGMRVAVNTLNSIGDTSVRASVNNAGADGSTVDFYEIAFPEMANAVLNGDVDAAWIVEPFATIAQDNGLEYLGSPYVGAGEDLNIAVYFTSGTLAAENPELVQEFAAAIEEAQTYAQENPEESRAVLSSYMELDPSVQERLVLPAFPSTITADSLQTVIDMLADQAVIPASFPADDVLLAP